MIVRLIAIDPRPRPGSSTDVLVYQIPDGSREFELICELLEQQGIPWQVIEASPRKKKGNKPV